MPTLLIVFKLCSPGIKHQKDSVPSSPKARMQEGWQFGAAFEFILLCRISAAINRWEFLGSLNMLTFGWNQVQDECNKSESSKQCQKKTSGATRLYDQNPTKWLCLAMHVAMIWTEDPHKAHASAHGLAKNILQACRWSVLCSFRRSKKSIDWIFYCTVQARHTPSVPASRYFGTHFLLKTGNLAVSWRHEKALVLVLCDCVWAVFPYVDV